MCIQPCKARSTIFDIKSNEILFYPFTVNVDRCGKNSNTIKDLYPQVCLPNKVKNVNVKVFNLASGVNVTRFII